MVEKAQVKIQQMLFMLLAVTVFFVLVGIFIIVIVFSGLKSSAVELKEKNALMLITKLANSPEFSCGNSYGSNKVYCVDADKMMMLKAQSRKYEGFWGASDILIRKINSDTSEVECRLDNYPNCNVIKIYEGVSEGADASNFVILCRKESSDSGSYDKCELAKMSVRYSLE